MAIITPETIYFSLRVGRAPNRPPPEYAPGILVYIPILVVGYLSIYLYTNIHPHTSWLSIYLSMYTSIHPHPLVGYLYILVNIPILVVGYLSIYLY